MTPSLRLAALALLVALSPHARADTPGSDWIVPPPHPGGIVDKFKFRYGPAIRWPGPIHWSYNHAGAPGQFSSAAVLSTLQAGINQWSNACGITFVYDGPTTLTPTPPVGYPYDGVNVIAWGPNDPYIQNANGVTVSIPFSSPDGGAYFYDADIILDNTGRNSTSSILATVAVHELGHVLGLAHSDVANVVMSGPPDVTYSNVGTLQADDVRGCRCLYGPAAGQNAAYTCSLPKRFDLGSIPIGTPSVPQLFTVFNDGNAGLVVNGVTGGGPDLQVGGSCTPGIFVAPGGNCTVSVTATPGSNGSHAQILTVATSDGPYTVPALYSGRTAGVATVDVVEFYNPTFDHYFITWVANEIAILDAGMKSPGWVRTGKHFPVYPQAQPGASPICRFYIPPDKGNSHFFGRGEVECASTAQKNPTFVNEDPAFMYMILPTNGVCPANTTIPVYRVFSNRPDANHRYMIDPAVRDQMVAEGWLAEGDGPDLVVMCAPIL
jgi:hypothetical protein